MAEWKFTEDALEHKSGYYIFFDRLGEVRDVEIDGRKAICSDWALHMIEKTWVDPKTFLPLLKIAIDTHAPKAGIDWEATLKKARKMVAEDACYRQAERNLGYKDKGINITDMEKIHDEMIRLQASGWTAPDPGF